MKFKPIIDEYKKSDYNKDYLNNFEYLANVLARIRKEREPSWNGPTDLGMSFDEAFSQKG
jgi:hypothetical protein